MPRIEIGVTDQADAQLAFLAKLGIHGASPEQCAAHLLRNELERLVIAGVLPGPVYAAGAANRTEGD